MNKRALFYGLVYAILVIAFKLAVLLSGKAVEQFYFTFSHFLTVLFILPFFIIAILHVRNKDLNGYIGGREAMKIALTVFAVGAVLTTIYNYFEFVSSGKELATVYYHSSDYLDYLKKVKTLKPEDYAANISSQIAAAENSAFKATTGKLFSLMLIGISGSVIVASILKRKPQ